MSEQKITNGIDLWFPTAIYFAKDIITEKENTSLINEAIKLEKTIPNGGENWHCDVYTTFDNDDLIQHKKFKNLFEKINEHVKIFAQAHGDDSDYMCVNSWLNINNKTSFQEEHTHPSAIFSVIYYLSAPEGSGQTVFKDSKPPDMYPLKNLKNRNNLSFDQINYKPETGKLLIFRSFTPHLVKTGTNESKRITISANYA